MFFNQLKMVLQYQESLIKNLKSNRLVMEKFINHFEYQMSKSYFGEQYKIYAVDRDGHRELAAIYNSETGGIDMLQEYEKYRPDIEKTIDKIKIGLKGVRVIPEIRARDAAGMQTLKKWLHSEIEWFSMLQVLSRDKKQRKQFAARVSQCRDTLLRIDELLATGELSEGDQ